MALNLNVTVLTVDTHDQAEFLHLLHQVGLAARLVAAHHEFPPEQRARVVAWREALRNHAGTDLMEIDGAEGLVRSALEADFLRVNLTATGDQATPADGLV
jgi:hypothetical protein